MENKAREGSANTTRMEERRDEQDVDLEAARPDRDAVDSREDDVFDRDAARPGRKGASAVLSRGELGGALLGGRAGGSTVEVVLLDHDAVLGCSSDGVACSECARIRWCAGRAEHGREADQSR